MNTVVSLTERGTCTIRRASIDADWCQAAALLHDHVEWMRGFSGFDPIVEQPALATELDGLAAHYAKGASALFLADWQAITVGTVAIRRHDDGSAELKRMYVRPVARGRGIADALVDAAVSAAIDQGCHSVWLETVRGAMNPAIAVYRRNGFTESTTRQATLSIDGVVVMERAITGCCRS